jgi:hypothetical protein
VEPRRDHRRAPVERRRNTASSRPSSATHDHVDLRPVGSARPQRCCPRVPDLAAILTLGGYSESAIGPLGLTAGTEGGGGGAGTDAFAVPADGESGTADWPAVPAGGRLIRKCPSSVARTSRLRVACPGALTTIRWLRSLQGNTIGFSSVGVPSTRTCASGGSKVRRMRTDEAAGTLDWLAPRTEGANVGAAADGSAEPLANVPSRPCSQP